SVLLTRFLKFLLHPILRHISSSEFILGPFCGLARGNPQWPGGLGLFSKSSHFDPLFIVD
ncbi:MAG: hypothetical protein AB1Z29_25880, partial [Desulfobacterales bacterium]